MDTHAEWKDIDYRSLLWKEIRLNTEIAAMPLAGRKQDHLSCLGIFTLDPVSLENSARLALDLCLAAPYSSSGLGADVTFSEPFLASLPEVAQSLSFHSI